jgi:hypothetical protein
MPCVCPPFFFLALVFIFLMDDFAPEQHYTCATDTKGLAFVLSAVNDVIIQANLRDCEFWLAPFPSLGFFYWSCRLR